MMQKIAARRCALVLSTAMIAALALHAGGARAQSATMSPALKALAAAADKEGTLVFQGSTSSWGGADGVKEIGERVNKAYGTHIAVKWTPGTSFPEDGNAIAVALRNKLPSPTDVYFGFSRNMAVFGKIGMFQDAPWSEYDPVRLGGDIVEQGKYVKIFSGTLGFSYNSETAPSKPEKLADFLKPEWKGKFATTPFAAGFDQLAAKEAWGPDKTLAFAKEFIANAGGFMLCTDFDRLASGEFSAFVTDCGGGNLQRQAASTGAPIVRVITPEYPLISFFYLGVPTNALHPNAAKLFITYLASPEGQKLTYHYFYADVHLYPDSRMHAEVEAVEKKFGFKFGIADVAWQETNAAGNAAQQHVAKLFRQSGK
ncbi:MAG TPA: ABC transporter substrate-binding protein [Stellaceae bacterium]|nr:ABC transporter substrate-binding protein [Stellaceae bacterium]